MSLTSAHKSVLALLMGAGAMALAGPASADVRFYAYDASDRTTQSLTRGITLEVRRGLMGATTLRGLFSTTSRGSARFISGGPSQARSVLPDGSTANQIYSIAAEGDGRALGRALCPGANDTWLIASRLKSGHPTTLHAVGLWSDGQYRHCVALNYNYRGEWAQPPGPTVANPDGLIQPR